ncbi:hypothetical protein [Sorangium sp. So ce1335]|uniref:hypothetical protein n=1 Tax=Sorangium sp. So ce1335 TaxID=3133335 RepID=UPI003F645757
MPAIRAAGRRAGGAGRASAAREGTADARERTADARRRAARETAPARCRAGGAPAPMQSERRRPRLNPSLSSPTHGALRWSPAPPRRSCGSRGEPRIAPRRSTFHGSGEDELRVADRAADGVRDGTARPERDGRCRTWRGHDGEGGVLRGPSHNVLR